VPPGPFSPTLYLKQASQKVQLYRPLGLWNCWVSMKNPLLFFCFIWGDKTILDLFIK
jgi:hypothetical protein